MKYELNHDSIAKQIRVKASDEMKTRRKVEQLVADAYESYKARGTLMPQELLNEIALYRDASYLSDEEKAFILKSENTIKAAQRKRRYITFAIIAILSALTITAFVQWQKALNRERLSNSNRLALLAKQEFERRNFNDAFKLAVESLKLYPDNALAADLVSQVYHFPLNREMIPICTHTLQEENRITNAAFSEDGREIALTEADSTVKILTIYSDEVTERHVLRGCDTLFTPVFSPQSDCIIVLKQDSVLSLNKINYPHEELQLRGHSEYVRGAIFLNQDTIISWANDGYIKMWNTQGKYLQNIGHLDGFIESIELSEDKTQVLAKTDGNQAAVFSLKKDAPFILNNKTNILAATILNKDSVISFSTEGVQMWSRARNGKTGKPLPVVNVERINKAFFIQRGETLVYQKEIGGHLVILTGIRTAFKILEKQWASRELQFFIAQGFKPADLNANDYFKTMSREVNINANSFGAFPNNGFQWLVEDGNNEVSIMSYYNEPVARLSHSEMPAGIAIALKGKKIATYSPNGTVKIWEDGPQNLIKLIGNCDWGTRSSYRARFTPQNHIATTAQMRPMQWLRGAQGDKYFPNFYAEDIAFSPDGKIAVAYPYSGNPVIMDSLGQIIRTLSFEKNKHGILFSKNGGHFTIIGENKIGIWTANGDLTAEISVKKDDNILPVIFTPDGKGIVIATRVDSNLIEWDLKGNRRRTLIEKQRILSFSYSHDGNALLVGNTDGDVALYKTDGQLIRRFGNMEGRITQTTFFPDDKKILVTDDQNGFAMYETNGRLIQNLFKGKSTEGVTVFPDGKHMLAQFADGVEIWNMTGKVTRLTTNDLFLKPPVYSEISPDGQRILLSFDDCTAVQFYTPQSILKQVEAHPNLQFSDFDKKKYDIH